MLFGDDVSSRAIHSGAPYTGLVRAVDRRARRHVYGLGRLPAGHLSGELGALASRAPSDGVAVWQAPDGRIVTDAYDAALRRRRLRTALEYVVEPVRWSRLGRRLRARALLRRALELRHAGRRGGARPGGEPVGYLYGAEEPGTRPLFSALHPVTGDQLLTTSPEEPDSLGYLETAELGQLRAAAPVTGTLGLAPTGMAWARECGLSFQSHVPRLAGALELPASGTDAQEETLRVAGWAVAHGDRLRRVDVFIDGDRVGQARLALPRGDLVRHPPAAASPDAVLAGFEFVPSSRQLVPGEVAISVLVESMSGETLVLEAAGVRVIRSRSAIRHDRIGSRLQPAAPRAGRLNGGTHGLLAFTHRLDHGGAQRYFVDQILRLQRAGYSNCTVVAFRDGPWRTVLQQVGVEVHVTSPYPRSGEREYEGRIEELRAWCEPRAHSVAFVNTLDCFMAADLCKRLGLPVAWALHESFDPATWYMVGHGWSDDHAYVFERLEHALADADATIFAADATRRLYESHVHVDRAVTMPYGIELGALDEYRQSFDAERERRAREIPAGARIVLCLAIFNSRKAQALLAQAFAMVAGDHPDAQLALVGETPGPYADAIRDYVAATSLSSRIRIVPATADAYAWHLLADVFALASDVESSPLSAIEAMALERPVLASRVFGVPELIEDGRTGFMFGPSDLGELASALDRVLSMDPSELRSVARAGGELVRDRHDPDRYSDQLLELLRSLDRGAVVAERP
jgi:D-inositol-3-phosphate glycosyltransferase